MENNHKYGIVKKRKQSKDKLIGGIVMFNWKDEYSVGIEIIDEQHQKLFEIGNRAYELFKDEMCIDHYDGVIDIVNELRDYTKFHFQTEEALMLEMNYKRYFTQKVAHDDFIEKIYEVDFDEIDDNPKEYIEEILSFIFDWITYHIIQQDKLIPGNES